MFRPSGGTSMVNNFDEEKKEKNCVVYCIFYCFAFCQKVYRRYFFSRERIFWNFYKLDRNFPSIIVWLSPFASLAKFRCPLIKSGLKIKSGQLILTNEHVIKLVKDILLLLDSNLNRYYVVITSFSLKFQLSLICGERGG